MSEMNERKIVECTDELAARFGKRYAVNEPNMAKLSKVYNFFRSLSEDEGGEVRCFDIQKESTNATVSFEVSILDLHLDSLARFIEILQYIDVFDAKSTESGGLLISAVISHVWEDIT